MSFFSQRVLHPASQQSVQWTVGILRHFRAFFYTRTESCSWSFIYARPTATNANRWLASQRANAKPSLIHKVSFYRCVRKNKFWFLTVAFFKSVFESGFQFTGFQVLVFLFNKFSFYQQSFGLVWSSR